MQTKFIQKVMATTLAVALISSCSTTEKFAVNAPVGSKLYSPSYIAAPIAYSSANGQAKVEVPSDMYCGYLLMKPENSEIMVPMGLDYCNRSHIGTKIALGSGSALAFAGVGTALIGSICLIITYANGEDEDVTGGMGMIAMAGAGVAGVGAALGAPSQSRMRQTAYDYNFGYSKHQIFEMPQLSSTLLKPNLTKEEMLAPVVKKIERKKAVSGDDATKKAGQSSVGTKAKKLKTNLATQIAGNYSGTGRLLSGNNVEESYSDIYVAIEAVDKNHVNLVITESGEEFFETVLTYVVTKNKKGVFQLVMDGLPQAKCSITKDGVMTFNHGKVNIDDQIYTLTISAKRK